MAQILDSDVDDAVARTRAAEDKGVAEDLEKQLGESEPEAVFSQRNLPGWAKRLPRNIGMGLFRAALNTVETADDIFQAGAEFIVNQPVAASQRSEGVSEEEGDRLIDVEPVAPLRTLFPGAFEAAHNFADESEELNTVSDDIVQGIAQFVIPFTSYLKVFGGIKAISTSAKIGKLALAEGITSASAFEAHEGRMADLFEMGRQMENDFGALLNKISPEGSLANAYIEWLISRENESALGGRYKNAVDSLVATAGIISLLKVVGTSIKLARKGIDATINGRKGSLKIKQDSFVEAPIPEPSSSTVKE